MKIGITFDYNSKGVKSATKDLQRLGKQSKITSLAIKKSQLAYTAASAALYKITKDSVRAIIEEEKSIKTLSNALRTVGLESATTQVEGFITSLESLSAVADDRLRPAFARIVSQIKDVAASQEVLQLATEISAATGKDLDTVVTALTRAYAGQRKGLLSLGVGMDATYLKTAGLDEIITALNDKFSGSNQATLDSYAGRVQKLSVAFGTMKEGIGKGLLDAFEMLFGGFDIGIQKVAEFGTTVGDFFRGLVVLWNKIKDNPIIKFLTRGLGDMKIPSVIGNIVEMGKAARIEAERLRQDDERENRRMGQRNVRNQISNAARVAKAVTTINKKVPAPGAGTGLTAEDRLKMQYDIERIGLAAALRKTTDEETRKRLQDLLTLNQMAYSSEASSIKEINNLINGLTASQNAYTYAVKLSGEEVARLGAIYTTSMAANQAPTAAAFRAGESLANAGLGLSGTPITTGSGAAPTTPVPTAGGGGAPVTININALSTMDIEEAIATAVNSGSRAGLAYTQVFSRL